VAAMQNVNKSTPLTSLSQYYVSLRKKKKREKNLKNSFAVKYKKFSDFLVSSKQKINNKRKKVFK
jgi:hypothetical protein